MEREREQGSGDGDEIFLTGFWERDGNEAEKDIAESPTAIAGTPKRKTKDFGQWSTDIVHIMNTKQNSRIQKSI